jgi:hypothetical protein
MLDEHEWNELPDKHKLEQLEAWLTEYRKLSTDLHKYAGTEDFEKIKLLKSELKFKIYRVIELEYIK